MKTREQYMTKEVTHREYYEQFVTGGLRDRVLGEFGKKKILAHFKSEIFKAGYIDLKHWDNITAPHGTIERMKECGDFLTLSGSVCIAKEAGLQVFEQLTASKGA